MVNSSPEKPNGGCLSLGDQFNGFEQMGSFRMLHDCLVETGRPDMP